VDGVLNCHGFVDLEDFDEVLVTGNFGQPETVVVPKGTDDRIKALLNYFDIVWATAWVGAAHSAFREHLGLPTKSWPHLNYERLKIVDIIKYANGRPWAWVDDIAPWELIQLGWNRPEDWDGRVHKRPNRYFEDNTFILAPDGRYGLDDGGVYKLIEFAKANS
jgi:hypothetical protein